MSYFDATQVPRHTTFDPLPEGWYHVTITGSAAHIGKKPAAGEMLKLTVEIDANEHPTYAGRQIFSYLCIQHRNELPRKIAQQQLASICHAVALDVMDAPEDLIGARLMARLKIRPAEGDYEASNDISSWVGVDDAPDLAPPSKPPLNDVDAAVAKRRKPSRGWE